MTDFELVRKELEYLKADERVLKAFARIVENQRAAEALLYSASRLFRESEHKPR